MPGVTSVMCHVSI